MTDWPDDWFRDGAGKAAASQANDGSGPPPGPGAATAGEGGGAEPTVQLPVRPGGANRPGAGPAAPLSYAAQGNQPGQADFAYPANPPGQPGQYAPAGSGWPEQPALRTPGRAQRPPRAGGPGGSGGPGGPGGSGWSRPGRTGWRRWLRPRPILATLAVLVCLAIIGSLVSYFYLDSKLTKANVLVDYAGRPAQGSGQTWLITGSDSRQGLSKAEMRKLATGFNVGGQRSDTIMLLHLPAGGGRPVLISIPRDSYVPIPGYGDNKINAAFSIGGPALLARTVQNLTGLRIDHYMGIGFGGFVRVVNAIGGVRMCLKAPLVDPAAGLHLHKGCQVLNGAEALGFVRTRHNFPTEDLQRIQNQRLFLHALLTKMTSTGVLINPFESLPAASGVAGTLTVDQGTNLYQLLKVAFALRNPITTTVPIANSNYLTQNAGDALLLNSAESAQLFKDLNTGKPIPRSLITGSSAAG